MNLTRQSSHFFSSAAGPATRARRANRRSDNRVTAPMVLCQVLDTAPRCEIPVINLSSAGACLVVPGPMPPGTVLRLRLFNREHLCCHEVALEVRHYREQASGSFLVGGKFLRPLPQSVLLALLA